jgi:putative hydrolase of the HAD superfamily
MTQFRAVFLDVGGTLLHLDRDFILSCLAERGIVRDRHAFAAADRIGRAAMTAILQSNNPGDDATRWRAYAQAMLTELGCTGADADAVRSRIGERNRAGTLWAHTEPGTRETLEKLKDDGYTIGIVSNADGRVHQFLEHAGLMQFLDFVVDSAVVGVEKPDRRIFEIACGKAGVQPHEAVHVGDLYEIDIVGARGAGITPVLFDPDDRIEGVDCDRIAAIPELLTWLRMKAAA